MCLTKEYCLFPRYHLYWHTINTEIKLCVKMRPIREKEEQYRYDMALLKSYSNWHVRIQNKQLDESIRLLDRFTTVYETEIEKLPYQLNLMDELRSNENAHSKILAKLLKYAPARNSFFEYLNENHGFGFDRLQIKSPMITAERMRIDVLIKEHNRYAIIIENKIHNAVEQPNQIANYIDKCIDLGVKMKDIYVIYLTKTKDNIPDDQTWGRYSTEEFGKRYCHISYRETILAWLNSYTETILPTEISLISALTQYIDHLNKLLYIKHENQLMEQNLQQFLRQELNLTTDNTENLIVVDQRIKSLNELSSQLSQLMNKIREEVFWDWRDALTEQYASSGNNSVFHEVDSHFIKAGVKFDYKGKRFSVLIEYNYNSIYLGVGRHYADTTLDAELKELFSPLNLSEAMKEEEPWWYGWKYTSFEHGYAELLNLIKLVEDRLRLK